MRIKITKRAVDALPAVEKDTFIWDTELDGFGLRASPSGVKTYIVQYRLGGRGSQQRRQKIGRHGAITPDQARNEAVIILGQVAQGKDPAQERREASVRGATVNDLADRYLTEHVDVKNKPITAIGFRRLVEKQIRPALGKLAVEKVTRADVAKLHHDMRATPRQANQTLAVLSKMFSLAEVWGLRPDESNPCKKIERYRENKRERFLSEAEIADLGETLAALESTESPTVLNAVRLLLLTGCRMGEVLALRWIDIDLETGALVILDGKSGGRLHPIGAQTIAFLTELQKAASGPDGKPAAGWVLRSTDPDQPLSKSTLEHAWQRIRTKAELEDVRLHDLRHTVGTYAGQTGANAFLVRDKLGHKTLAMTGRYVNRDANPLRDLSDKVEGRISAALKAKTEGVESKGEIIPLRPDRVAG
ncbi:tyrosine-type recombinase/integrase [Azospirillum argentinense]